MKLSYLITDYLLYEKKEFDKIDKLLREGKFVNRERKKLKELAEWHFQNCMEAVKGPGIPKCVKDFVFGFRKEPTLKEVQEGYRENREYWNQKRVEESHWLWKVGALVTAFIILFTLLKIYFLYH